jgi:hypothetical protein
MSKVFVSALAVGAFAWLTGCGTSSTAVPVDSGAAADGAGGGTTDGSAGLDSGASQDAGPSCHPVGVTQADCRSCCQNAYPTGSNSFDTYLLQCACQGNYCGPLEGGAPEAGSDDAGDAGASDAAASDAATADSGPSPSGPDAGPYGNAVCTATCNGQALPDTVCNDCILQTLGSVNSAGPCQSHVLGLCLSDTTCNEYLGCVETCP